MALFGEVCARCGERRTKKAYAGVPTCDDCVEKLLGSLQAMGENTRICPVDAAEMTKEIVLNIVVDRCPACQGIWLDGGELDLLKQALKAGMSDDFARAMLLPW